MLVHLSLRQFAVVSAADLEFGPGLTVISGETGAGKSLLVDALGFVAGLRADSSVVRHGAERAELIADFDLMDSPAASTWLRDTELDDPDAPGICQIRRVIRADGGSKAWINGRGATLSQLTEFTTHLVEIHGQHEHQALLSRSSQLELLDAFGGTAGLRHAVADAAAVWSALLREREVLTGRGDVSDRIDYLAHQHAELERDVVEAAAYAQLQAEHRRHAHASDLTATCERVFLQLAGDDEALSANLHRARAELTRAGEYEPRLHEVDAMLDAAAIQVDEAIALLERVRDGLDLDPSTFDALDTRLARLHELARKHRIPVDDLPAHRDAVAVELESLRNAGERLGALGVEIEAARALWTRVAADLSTARRVAASRLATETTALIGELGMGGGRFDIAIEPTPGDRPDPMGAERLEFLVAANPGQPPRALRKVASGGELSRISLAIEVAALGMDAVPTMVFDEVDSGIGGAVADIVGRKLRALGESRQVLCVTHLPQVAAQGHAHYRVSKASTEGITQSAVTRLSPKDREEELARMLGGVELSKEVRAAAKRLLRDVSES